MEYRLATMNDGQLLLDWRNDEATRINSHSMDFVDHETHINWLNNIINDKSRLLFIVEHEGSPIGTIRADIENSQNVCELSWTIAPTARGMGFGKKMVSEYVKKVSYVVRAEVKEDNIASIKIAEAADLKFHKKAGSVLYYISKLPKDS